MKLTLVILALFLFASALAQEFPDRVSRRACSIDAECDDGCTCTDDYCNTDKLRCFYVPIDNCCTIDKECADNNPCTVDQCINERCFNTEIPDCCSFDVDCNDGNVNTEDTCVDIDEDFWVGTCQYTPITDGCETWEDCTPQDCHTCHCRNNRCEYEPIHRCCDSDGDCDDDDVCTRDTCAQAQGDYTQVSFSPLQCYNEIIPGCCEAADEECDDDNVCTVDSCITGTNTCDHDVIPGCCNCDEECEIANECVVSRCNSANRCVYEQNMEQVDNVECCDITKDNGEQQCDDGNRCTIDACVNWRCEHTWDGLCCNDDEDCDVVSPSTGICDRVTCRDIDGSGENKECRHTDIEHELGYVCCENNDDCDDGSECTTDKCILNTCRHYRMPSCCSDTTDDAECNDNNECTDDSCNFDADKGKWVCEHIYNNTYEGCGCGNGRVDPGEECDMGNAVEWGCCDCETCTLNRNGEFCGQEGCCWQRSTCNPEGQCIRGNPRRHGQWCDNRDPTSPMCDGEGGFL